MKKYFSKRKNMQLAALVVSGLLSASAADAADLVVTVPSDYTNSELGTVSGSRVTTHIDAETHKAVMQGLGGDFAPFNYHQQGKSMLFARRYTYSTTNLLPSFLLDPNKLGASAKTAEGIVSAVPNAHAAVANDGFIYMTGYDLGQIGVARQNGAVLLERTQAKVNLMDDIKTHAGYQFTETYQDLDKGTSHTGDPTKAKVHGNGLFIDGRNLYVAASVNPSGGYNHYDDGFLMQYRIKDDGSLEFGSYTRIARNDGGRINKFNDVLMLSAIGGKQYSDGTGNNKHTALSIARLDSDGKIIGTAMQNAKIPAAVKALGQDFRDIRVMPNGTAYVMTYNLDGGAKVKGTVYQTTVSNLLSDTPDDWTKVKDLDEAGWFGSLDAEHYTKRLWLREGNKFHAYEDGAKGDAPTHTWQAKDFASNPALYQFNAATTIAPDHVTGTTASVVLAAAAAENPDAVWKSAGEVAMPLTADASYSADTTVSLGKTLAGDRKTNVLAGVYAASGDVHVNAAGRTLQLQVENTVGNPTGVYAGNGKNVTIDAGKVNILTKGLAGGNTLTNAIQLDAAKDAASNITINAPVNISMAGGLGGNGVAVQKSDRFGEKSYEASVGSAITINGDLKIAGEKTDQWGIPINRENVFSRFNNAGILTQVEKSKVTVKGNVDMTVYGNGVTTNAKDSIVNLGGGKIQVPAGMKYSYYALGAYQGTINMNTGADGETPGTRDVNLDGDLFALSTGKLNVALTTANSGLHGLVDNGGTANLYLQNGAQWTNEGRNERYYQDDEDKGAGIFADGKYVPKSRITNLHGGAAESSRGFIFQKNAQEIAIDNYSGHTKVVYEHDAATPTAIKGGDIHIAKAAADSGITVSTHNAGLNTESTKAADKNLVSATLNALANKLYYTAYTTGERNLAGTAEIAEGLISSSATLKVAPITFRSDSGQGRYIYAPETDPKPDTPKPDTPKPDTPKPDTPKPDTPKPDIPKPDTPKPDTPKPDTPKPEQKTEFSTGITGDESKDAAYKDGGVRSKDGGYVFGKSATVTAPTGISASKEHPVTVTTSPGATLKLNATDTGIDAMTDSSVKITGERLEVQASAEGAHSIKAAKNANVDISSGFDITGAIENSGGAITLNDANKTSALKGDVYQRGGTFNLTLSGKGSHAQSAIRNNGGTVNLDITGDGAQFTGSIRKMSTMYSALRAVSAASPEQNIRLGAKATWNVTDASDITNLTAEGGRIVQQSDGLLNIKNYTGNSTVFYEGTADKDGNLSLAHKGKVQLQNVTGTNNRLTFATKAFGETDETEKKVAAALAGQFRYTGDRAENIENNALKNLDLNVVIGEGILKSEVTYRMLLDPATGLAGGIKEIDRPLIGSYETQVMRGVKSAMASSAMAWRAEANDLMKRMGDLRLSPEDDGVWARIYRGKSSSDKDGTDYSMKYTTVQIGYDKKAGKDWRVGVAGSYLHGSSSYEYGSGKNKEGNFGVYGTWSGKDGDYVDIIAKVGRLSNDYTAANSDGLYVKGDYKTWGMSMSAEYGKRIATAGGSYIEPQAELIYTHLNGANYRGLSNYTFHNASYPDLDVRQSAFNSFIGRVGIGFGKETERSTYYAKLSLYHEFAGSLSTDYVVPTQSKSTHQDFKDTWVGLQLGGTVKLNDRTSLYGDFEKTFGGDIKTDWRIDAGLRWSF